MFSKISARFATFVTPHLLLACLLALGVEKTAISQDAGQAMDGAKVQFASGPRAADQDAWLNWIAQSGGNGSQGNKSWFSSWGTPKSFSLWPKSKPVATSYSQNNKSTWQKMTMTSKRWWRKTAEVLDPYPEPKLESSMASSSKKSNWMTDWMQPEERKFNSVNDWAGQPMLK